MRALIPGLLFVATLSTLLLTGCYRTHTSTISTLNPYRAPGITPEKVGNVELIVSNIDPAVEAPKVLVEIVPVGTDQEQLDFVRRRLMYYELPMADAKMLVQSNYTLKPGSYDFFFWEEMTGTMSKRRITIAEENNYIVAFFRTKTEKNGELDRHFRIMSSKTPVMDGYLPAEVGRF